MCPIYVTPTYHCPGNAGPVLANSLTFSREAPIPVFYVKFDFDFLNVGNLSKLLRGRCLFVCLFLSVRQKFFTWVFRIFQWQTRYGNEPVQEHVYFSGSWMSPCAFWPPQGKLSEWRWVGGTILQKWPWIHPKSPNGTNIEITCKHWATDSYHNKVLGVFSGCRSPWGWEPWFEEQVIPRSQQKK